MLWGAAMLRNKEIRQFTLLYTIMSAAAITIGFTLHSKITKMTQRIRDQNRELIKEKGHLADSLADIAHQLRTPLTSVNLIMTLLANSPAEGERESFYTGDRGAADADGAAPEGSTNHSC